MSAASGAALSTAMAYYHAWTSKDMDTAMSLPSVHCIAPGVGGPT